MVETTIRPRNDDLPPFHPVPFHERERSYDRRSVENRRQEERNFSRCRLQILELRKRGILRLSREQIFEQPLRRPI